MSAADIVTVVISLSGTVSATVEAFGTPGLCGYHTHYTDRLRTYPTATALAQMVTDGFSTTEPLYRMMEVACAQSPAPSEIAIMRRALPYTQTLHIAFTSTSTADPPYTLTVVGSDNVSHTYTRTSTGVPATDAAAFAALMTAANIGTVTTSTSIVTITQSSGKLTDLQNWTPGGLMVITDATADPGIATDLAAIENANANGWYILTLDSNSKAEIAAAQAWIEATGQGGKVACFSNADRDCVNSGATDDVFTALEQQSYEKCYAQYSGRQLLSYGGVAAAAIACGFNPGQYTLAFKSQAGVLADTSTTLTETEQLALDSYTVSNPVVGGKNGNWYATVSGINMAFPGTAPKPQWFDVIVFVDWLQANLQADVLSYLAGQTGKAPFTDFGLQGVGNTIKNRLNIGASPQYGGIDGSQPITVNVPTAASFSQSQKNSRAATGFSFSCTLSGALNGVPVQGTVVP